ncbi:hypothetical protein OHT76_01130 [Streptomyces sp. NBC_00287]|uniref:hypothetical protein n=1 Tax=Streptomyces sp. NBC_00287 TaxID=2975702 RepID=UPI002E2D2707|nr:hypothetical protein [Streptomyces sp. NBC_00287]
MDIVSGVVSIASSHFYIGENAESVFRSPTQQAHEGFEDAIVLLNAGECVSMLKASFGTDAQRAPLKGGQLSNATLKWLVSGVA